MKPTTNFIPISVNNSLLKHQHRDTIDHRKTIYCIIHHVAKRLQVVDEDGAIVDSDGDDDDEDDYTGGGRSPPEVIPAVFPACDLHRRGPANSLLMGS
jgi:hypothetical protein